ncbi:hypothetical protein [Adhaeribacter aquaticus]|uniref:hypothetical protein n=1 Tax=Adhaeribacter aquaticus TaxID=299567 RepID=UPI00042088DE|nr:hypothetical protein [Adhaeribacter aquaticus]
MLETLLQIAKENPFGFTFNIRTANQVKFGVVVAYKETQNSFGTEGLKIVITHAQAHDQIVGGWLNTENNQYYFDSCKVFRSRKEAIEFGREQEQLAIFDLTNLEEIKL